MAKFVMANRRAGRFGNAAKRASRESMEAAFAGSIRPHASIIAEVAPPAPEERRVVVFEADPVEVAENAKELPPDVILEPVIPHYPAINPRFQAAVLPHVAGAAPPPPGRGEAFSIEIRGSGTPLQNATVTLYLLGGAGRAVELTGITSSAGRATFSVSRFWTPTALLVLPAGGFWSFVVRGPRHGMVVDVPPLPNSGPIEWWHRLVGVDSGAGARGAGIRIGVVDTGVGPHPHLSHVVDAGSFVDSAHDPAGGRDSDTHGTHVCGTIGARPDGAPGSYEGIAPEAHLASARVFQPGSSANQGDIALAIDHLSKVEQCDLINLSLGAPVPSEILHDSVLDALERGTLCICAAANSASAIEYPAAFPECVAVTALGLEGWGPPGTLSASRYPVQRDRYGVENLFLADFSCFGPEADCCAPGVGILATVPAQPSLSAPYAAMDGTSMASPVACAALAVILSRDPAYREIERDLTRAQTARALLRQHCRDAGLASLFQGRGYPVVA